MNKKKLRAKMVQNGDTYQSLAAVLGKSYVAVWQKMNSKRPFTQDEMKLIIDRYHLKPVETQEIFFASEVS